MLRIITTSLLFLIVVFNASLIAQELKVINVKPKEFPSYQGELIVRNPEGIDPSRVIFNEGDSILKVTFGAQSMAPVLSSKKEVLLLVLNHQSHKDRTKWYQSIIKDAIQQGLIQAGDSYAIQSFDCQRPEYNEPKKQLLFPESPRFVTSSNELLSQVDEINLNKERFLHNCIARSDIYGALFEAMETFNKMPIGSGVTRSIVVFADDYSLVTKIGQDNIIVRGREYDIPVYAITYWQNNQNKYGVEPICEATYGRFFVDKNRDKSSAVAELLSFSTDMSSRAAGISYPFTFDSPFEKDGLTHGVKVVYNKTLVPMSYESPKMNLMEWIGANPFTAVVIFVGSVLLIIALVILMKKNKRRKEEKERAHEEELKRMETQQADANLKVARQEEEIQNIRQIEREKEALARQEKLNAQKEEENKFKVQQMSARGNLPWFTFEFQGQLGSFEVNHSEFTVGRDDTNNYRINLPIVSRQHFKVSFDSGVYTLSDLESSNGTFVNGQKCSKCVLKHGDVINIGDVNLTFHI